MRINKKVWTTSADLSANYVGDEIPTDRLAFGAIQVQWTGSPVGDLKLFARVNKVMDFVEIDTVNTSGITGHAFTQDFLAFEDYQIQFVHSSGSGTGTVAAIFKSADI